ncbi:hypothetical protein [Phascolarctobacterium sp.]|nr:hypothetical protein [Phascolarctobacterium sp.]
MAFKLGELRAGLVNTAVGVDIEMVVVVKLEVRRVWLLSAAVLMMFAFA